MEPVDAPRQARHVESLVELLRVYRYGHREEVVPSRGLECVLDGLDQQGVVLVIFRLALTGDRVLPVEVESVKVVFAQELNDALGELGSTAVTGWEGEGDKVK